MGEGDKEKDGVCPLFYGKVNLKAGDAICKLDKKVFFFLSSLTVKSSVFSRLARNYTTAHRFGNAEPNLKAQLCT